MITPQDFVARWSQSALREQQAAQSHFNELCQLIGHKTPTQLDPGGEFFTFEENVEKATGGKGRADVWYRAHFAWEYKGKHKDLDAAYAQLLAYRGALDNPPLLVVCDFLEYRIYPQWPNTSGAPWVFRNDDLLREDSLRYIRWLLESPHRFLEQRKADLEQREDLTLGLARKFAQLAELMRETSGPDDQLLWEPMQIARFLTKLVFALFVEDVGLMPEPFGQPAFRYITVGARETPEAFVRVTRELFMGMNGEMSDFIMKRVPYFDGQLFAESAPGQDDGLEVLDLTLVPGGIDLLAEASEADWRHVNPSIFGTLFEGALDPAKRAQLGAHYTGEADIRLVVEPVLMDPLNSAWDSARAEAEPLLQSFLAAEAPRAQQAARDHLIALHDAMMRRLGETTVLDPACGSGNFLYVSLRALKDLEGKVRKFFEPLGLPFRDIVTPRQLHGIEKDAFAARLAYVVVWIGYLQWRYEDEGVLHFHNPRKWDHDQHPRVLPNPILQDDGQRIFNEDAILRDSPLPQGEGQGVRAVDEPEWPAAEVILGNPPFLGGNRIRSELGGYVDDLFALYAGRVPPPSDLVCYWFEKARAQIEAGKAQRAGLLATNSIRGGANRAVLERIKQSGDIFMAWSDRPWVLQGAAVRISIVGFDDGAQASRMLDGQPVERINADLTTSVDLIGANRLTENLGVCHRGNEKHGAFDVDAATATMLLAAKNPSGVLNSDVVRRYFNALDVVRRDRDVWIIDFVDMSREDAEKYVEPFEHVLHLVKPERDKNNRLRRREYWWQHGEIIPNMRRAIAALPRYIVTPAVAKHRVYSWLAGATVPDHQLIVFARADDYFFGVLHSTLHEVWSLRLGTWLGKGNDPRYTPTTTFETFPFPWPPGHEDTASPQHAAISAAAAALHAEREAWLNPPVLLALGADAGSKALKERTLTNLYNELVRFREEPARFAGLTADAPDDLNRVLTAREFAPRLAALHDALDRAVLAAYGWDDLFETQRTDAGKDELLRRLLTLNHQRAAG